MIGNAIIKEISTDRFLDGIHISTRTIKDATGVAFKIDVGNAKSSLIRSNRHAAADKTNPKKTARKNPPAIRTRENAIFCQNDKVCTNESRHHPTDRGDASNISRSNAMLPSCQRAAQKTMVHILMLFFFLFLICIIIEIILR